MKEEQVTERKCAVVLCTCGEEAKNQFGDTTAVDFTPLKVFSSTLRAKDYCEMKAREVISRNKDKRLVYNWETDTTLFIYHFNGENYDDAGWRFEIHETEVDNAVPIDFTYPAIEKENEALRNECWDLRYRLARLVQRNAVAAAYATMWDGGSGYTKERILEILHTIREVLSVDINSGVPSSSEVKANENLP